METWCNSYHHSSKLQPWCSLHSKEPFRITRTIRHLTPSQWGDSYSNQYQEVAQTFRPLHSRKEWSFGTMRAQESLRSGIWQDRTIHFSSKREWCSVGSLSKSNFPWRSHLQPRKKEILLTLCCKDGWSLILSFKRNTQVAPHHLKNWGHQKDWVLMGHLNLILTRRCPSNSLRTSKEFLAQIISKFFTLRVAVKMTAQTKISKSTWIKRDTTKRWKIKSSLLKSSTRTLRLAIKIPDHPYYHPRSYN